MANKRYDTYLKKYEKFKKENALVIGNPFTGKPEPINNREYRQCYNPNVNYLKQLPKYWFVSQDGYVITLKYDTPKFLKPLWKELETEQERQEHGESKKQNEEKNGSSRPQFKINYDTDMKKYNERAFRISKSSDNITSYVLAALVWEQKNNITPLAHAVLEKKGISCLGSDRGNELKVQGHHIKKLLKKGTPEEEFKELNNLEDVQVMTNYEHKLFTLTWNEEAYPDEKKYMEEHSRLKELFRGELEQYDQKLWDDIQVNQTSVIDEDGNIIKHQERLDVKKHKEYIICSPMGIGPEECYIQPNQRRVIGNYIFLCTNAGLLNKIPMEELLQKIRGEEPTESLEIIGNKIRSETLYKSKSILWYDGKNTYKIYYGMKYQ